MARENWLLDHLPEGPGPKRKIPTVRPDATRVKLPARPVAGLPLSTIGPARDTRNDLPAPSPTTGLEKRFQTPRLSASTLQALNEHPLATILKEGTMGEGRFAPTKPLGIASMLLQPEMGGERALGRVAARTLEHEIPKVGEKFAVLTAENPFGKKAAAEFNAAQNSELLGRLKELGHTPIPVKGAYPDEHSGQQLFENSFYVPGMEPAQAMALGKEFGQNSVVTHEGLHDLAAKKLFPSQGIGPADGNIYTELPNGKRFVLDLNWDSPKDLGPIPSLDPHDERVLSATIKLPNGRVYGAPTHFSAMNAAARAGEFGAYAKQAAESGDLGAMATALVPHQTAVDEGFSTNLRHHISREQAYSLMEGSNPGKERLIAEYAGEDPEYGKVNLGLLHDPVPAKQYGLTPEQHQQLARLGIGGGEPAPLPIDIRPDPSIAMPSDAEKQAILAKAGVAGYTAPVTDNRIPLDRIFSKSKNRYHDVNHIRPLKGDVVAALKLPDGRVSVGENHAEAMSGLTEDEIAKAEDGFLTRDRKFLTRDQTDAYVGRNRGGQVYAEKLGGHAPPADVADQWVPLENFFSPDAKAGVEARPPLRAGGVSSNVNTPSPASMNFTYGKRSDYPGLSDAEALELDGLYDDAQDYGGGMWMDPEDIARAQELEAKNATPKPTRIDVRERAPSMLDLLDGKGAPNAFPAQTDLPRHIGPRIPQSTLDAVHDEALKTYLGPEFERMTAEGHFPDWYVPTEPRQMAIDALGDEAGPNEYKGLMDFMAATTARSDPRNNLRRASYYRALDKAGLLDPEALLSAGYKDVPKGMGHLANDAHHKALAGLLQEGGINSLTNPKPASFTANLQGNFRPFTNDTRMTTGAALINPKLIEMKAIVPAKGSKGAITYSPRSWAYAPMEQAAQQAASEYAGRGLLEVPNGADPTAFWQAKVWDALSKMLPKASPSQGTFGDVLKSAIGTNASRWGVSPSEANRLLWMGHPLDLPLGSDIIPGGLLDRF